MKKLIAALTFSALLFCGFAEEDDDLFDDIFNEETDIESPLVTEPVKTPLEKIMPKKISFSGSLNADMGFLYTLDPNGATPEEMHKPRGFFDIENTFYINARPADIFSVKASIYTAIQNRFILELKELYFDYNPFPFLYITAGKREIKWGYVRLFSDKDFYNPGTSSSGSENKYGNSYSGTMYTNLMIDSKDQLSLQLTFPWSSGSATLLALYNINNLGNSFASLDIKDLSFAASIEQTFWHTSVNLFMRTYGQKEMINNNGEQVHKRPAFGIEAKRTVFKADLYAQELIRVADFKNLNHSSGYERNILTLGAYRKWDFNVCDFGINAEYQFQYAFTEKASTHLTAVDAGVSKLGPKQNMKVGVAWNQNYSENSGDVSLVFQVSKLIPFADIKNVLQFYYANNKLTNFQAGITLYVNCGY